ncbi:hypothetical protein [Rhizobium mesoamericanum]|uniref:hypothetical protein n=1 Tax=Rhizobium mesoamericanum TaxID=1079800 RepID=UPI0012F8FC07|nr:hypothetical protein [Rhizobium mesoamericanum]
MNHGMAHLDARPEAIDNQPSRLALKKRYKITGQIVVALVDVHGDGQLALEMLDNVTEFFGIVTPNNQCRSTEDFLLKLLMGEEGSGCGFENASLALIFTAGASACDGRKRVAPIRPHTLRP